MTEYAVVNPATGETHARYDTFTDAQVEGALSAAQAAFEAWRTVPVAERARMVGRAAAPSGAPKGAGGHHRPGDGQAVRRRGR